MTLRRYLKNQAAWAKKCAKNVTLRLDAITEDDPEYDDLVDEEYFYLRLAEYFEGQLEWYEGRGASHR